MEDQLTPKEEAAVERTMAEMKFYDQYKEFMGEVKTIFLTQGPEAAKYFIVGKSDHLLTIACDEMFFALFNKL